MVRITRKIYTLECKGRGHFPLDMLRYGQGWPAGETDSEMMNSEHMERRTIMVCACVSNPAFLINILNRFSSFGWTATVEGAE